MHPRKNSVSGSCVVASAEATLCGEVCVRHRHRDTQTHTETEHRDRTQSKREKERQRDRETETETERDRERQRETERDRERQRETERDRERQRETEIETDRQTQRQTCCRSRRCGLLRHGGRRATVGRCRGYTRAGRTATRECLAAEAFWGECIGACLGHPALQKKTRTCEQYPACSGDQPAVQAQRLSALAMHITRGEDLVALTERAEQSSRRNQALGGNSGVDVRSCVGCMHNSAWPSPGQTALTKPKGTRVRPPAASLHLEFPSGVCSIPAQKPGSCSLFKRNLRKNLPVQAKCAPCGSGIPPRKESFKCFSCHAWACQVACAREAARSCLCGPTRRSCP